MAEIIMRDNLLQNTIRNEESDCHEEMVEIVINETYGGFGISEKAFKLYCKKTNLNYDELKTTRFLSNVLKRTDPILIQLVKELGKEVNYLSKLVIYKIPKGTKYRIVEYDGFECIETRDSIDWLTA
jgi:hypothetical protein